ncbi:MAG: hypothetical protein JW861_05235 [Bacteroidales bacterium]|nr:hypothetical protein [Bacteroidales bacterium]
MKESHILMMIMIITIIIAGCKKKETTDDSTLDTTEHHNYVQILPDGFNPVMTYIFSGNYSITDKQPWSGVSSSTVVISGSNALQILALAGRKGSGGPADWFKTNVSAAINSQSLTGLPDELNFAFTGTLTIDGNSYPVTLGQGHPELTTFNNWWIGGPGWTIGNDSIKTPDGKYVFFGDVNLKAMDYQFGVREK